MPAVGLDCPAHRGQPQAGSTWFSCEECVEDAPEAVIRDAAPGILDFDDRHAVRAGAASTTTLDSHGNASFMINGFNGVDDEVEHGALHLRRVDHDYRRLKRGLKLDIDLGSASGCLISCERNGAVHNLVERFASNLPHTHPRLIEKHIDNRVNAADLVANSF